jgi:O-methyltransferase
MQALMTPAKSKALILLLSHVRHLDGVIVELGVFMGGTLRSLADACPGKHCYGFDSFAGMPAETWQVGEFHMPGEFAADFDTVAKAMPPNVTLIKGLFPESSRGVDVGRICFAHADLDHGKGTADAIEWLRPRMVSGGIVVFDDYRWKNCPNVSKVIERAGLRVVESAPCQCYWTAP